MTTPGWYPDPYNRPGTECYWDGTQWTDHIRPAQVSPAPSQPVQRTSQSGGPRKVLIAGTAAAIVLIALGAALGGSDPETPEVAGATTVLDEAVTTTADLVDRALELDQGDDSEPSTTARATYTGLDCVAAVLHELEVIHSEIENPWTEEWSTNTDENPLLRADDEVFVTCTNSGPTPEGFSEVWTRVREDYRALRLHIKFGEPRPSIEDVTPLADVEAFLTE